MNQHKNKQIMKNALLLFLLFMASLSAQASSEKALQYHKLISEAEKQHLDKHYVQSQAFYEQAFSVFEVPLPIDLQNAMINATAANDKNSFFLYAKMLSKNYGASKAFFMRQAKFNLWNHTPEWEALLTQAQQNHSDFNAKKKHLIKEIDSLYKAVEYYKNDFFFKHSFPESYYMEKRKEIGNYLSGLFSKYGYISAIEIGLNYEDDIIIEESKVLPIIEFSKMIFKNGEIEIAISNQFDIPLKKAFENGKISYQLYTKLYSFLN